ncbi:MAG: cytochrome c [Chloroflexi bacterium]|nr:cytochrome c [Chloroflexota bacterium]MCL5108532.1 cytochrome c [Chloroflexota bacterium]
MDATRRRRSGWAVWALSMLLGFVATWAVAEAAPAPQDAAQGQQLFEAKCAGCHSIGGGRKVGPDLKGVTAQQPHDWLVQFITAPDQVIASGDARAKQLVREYGGLQMPNLGFSAAQANDVLAYVEQQSAAGAQTPAAAQQPAPAAQGNPAAGQAYFLGERRLANGGPPCIGCHTAAGAGALGGGSWGLNLSQVPSTQNPAGTVGILQAPPFPGMIEAFVARPLRPAESADIAAYLAQVHGQAAPGDNGLLFAALGVVLLAVLFGLTQLFWRGRFRGARKPLVGGRGR